MNSAPRLRPILRSTLVEAEASPMIAHPPVEKRWLRLAQFLGLAALFVLGSAIVSGLVAFLIMGGDVEMLQPSTAFPTGPDGWTWKAASWSCWG